MKHRLLHFAALSLFCISCASGEFNDAQTDEKPVPPAENPNTPIEKPNLPTDEPNLPTDEPNLPTDEPNLPTDEPNLPTDEPNLPTDEPNLPTDEPNLPTDEPNLPTETPHTWAVSIASDALSNLFKVNDAIYRSAQPDENGFAYAVETLGVRSVLSVRFVEIDIAGAGDWAQYLELHHISMVPLVFNDDDIVRAMQIIRDAPKPILVHCVHGSDRTGLVIAIYRILFESWTKDEAIDELKNGGFGYHEAFEQVITTIENLDIETIRARMEAEPE